MVRTTADDIEEVLPSVWCDFALSADIEYAGTYARYAAAPEQWVMPWPNDWHFGSQFKTPPSGLLQLKVAASWGTAYSGGRDGTRTV